MMILCIIIHLKKFKEVIIRSRYSLNTLIFIKILYSLLAIALSVFYYHQYKIARIELLFSEIKTYSMFTGMLFFSGIFTIIFLFLLDD